MIKNLRNKKKKGFTLIELIIVIAIIAILSAIAVPQFSKIRQNANENADLANAKTIHSAVSALIASEEITLPSSTATIVLPNKTTEGTDSQDTTNKKNLKAVTSYLETVPVPKSKQGSQFEIKIKDDGCATISYKDGKEIYPDKK